MKKKKRNFIIKIFSLLLLGIISITLLGSWSYDPATDTITSQNLWDEQWEVGALVSNGYINTQESSRRTSSFINILPHHYYSYSAACVGGRYAFYDSNKNLVQFNIDGLENPPTYSPLNAYYLRITFRADYGTTYNHDIMINEGQTLLPYEPYGTYVNQSTHSHTNEEYDSLYEDYESWRSDYQELSQQYDQLEEDFNTLQQNYNDLSSRFSTLTDEYDTLLEEYQDLQQQIVDLNSQITELSKISSNLYNLFYHCDIYVFEDTTNKGIDYYSSHLSEADSSFMQLVISSTAISFNYDMIPDYIRTFISSSEDYCFVLFKFNNTDLNGLYNIFFNDYTFDFEVQLYNDVTNQKLTYNMLDNGSLSNAIVIDTNNILYNYMLFDTTMDYHFTKFYTSDFTNVYNQGYENGIRQNYLVIDDLRSQIKTANNTITSLRRQIDSLNEQLANNIGWKPLFFAMADTPFKVVSNVLGFEVFGVNLFKVFVGIITGLAIIWLLKKLLGK